MDKIRSTGGPSGPTPSHRKPVDPDRGLVTGAEETGSLKRKMAIQSPGSPKRGQFKASRELPQGAEKVEKTWGKYMHHHGKKS